MRNRRRLSSRQNRKKTRKVFRLLMLFLLCGALAAGVYFARQSKLFLLREIVFYGNKYLSDEELKALMQLDKRENLISLSSSELAKRLSSSPWVKDVSLRKEYPSRLLVRIKEAVPVALLQSKSGLYLIDTGGNVLEKLKGQAVPFLPVIVTGRSRNPDTFSEAIALAKVIKETGLATEKERIEITGIEKGPENLTMKVDGLVVKIGEGQYEEKLSRLIELTDEIKRRSINVDYVDLRFSNRVIVKPVAEVVR